MLFQYSIQARLVFSLLVLSACQVGCRPDKPIEVSTHPKPPELMLVGISIRGDTVWSIKLANKREKILAAENAVYDFARSFDFASDGTDPTWSVPADWKLLPKKTEFRIATFEIQDAEEASDRTQVLISRIRMGSSKMSDPDKIVANINRWRKEMNAEEIINFSINEDRKAVEKSAASLVVPFLKEIEVAERPMFFDKIGGVYQNKSNAAPFMAAMKNLDTAGSRDNPGGDPDNGPGNTANGDRKDQDSSKVQGPSNPGTGNAQLPFEFEQPADWKLAGSGSVVIARFVVGEKDQQAEIKISKFPGSAESVNWRSTVSMWQNQFNVPVTSPENLEKITTVMTTGQYSAQLTSLSGQKDQAGKSLLGAMIIDSDSSNKSKWFIKMTGPETVVEAQKLQFESFVKSIRFRSVNSQE